MPDREIAARLAALRRAGVDLERRLRGDVVATPDSESYWRPQIEAWRAEIEAVLAFHPFQLRTLQQPIGVPEGESWSAGSLRELAEVRARLDATIERLRPDE